MTPSNDLPPTLTVDQAAEMLGVSRQSAYTAVRKGEIPSISVGRRKVIPTASFLRLLGVQEDLAVAGKAVPVP